MLSELNVTINPSQMIFPHDSTMTSSIPACLILKNEIRFLVRRAGGGEGDSEEIVSVDIDCLGENFARRYADRLLQSLG